MWQVVQLPFLIMISMVSSVNCYRNENSSVNIENWNMREWRMMIPIIFEIIFLTFFNIIDTYTSDLEYEIISPAKNHQLESCLKSFLFFWIDFTWMILKYVLWGILRPLTDVAQLWLKLSQRRVVMFVL